VNDLANSHPFVRQLDVVFPCHEELEKSLKGLSDKFWIGRLTLSQIVEAANYLSDQFALTSELIALSLGSIEDDAWCIDSCDILSLSLTKETYEFLGLLGVQRTEGHTSKFLVRLNLHDRTSKQFVKAKEAIKLWDERRSASADSAWVVAFHTSNTDILDMWSPTSKESQISCNADKLASIIIPKSPIVDPPPGDGADKEERLEDWNSSVAELFEWTGMACLHSQRLLANDSVHSYVSSYQPPQDNYIGDALHICWRGLLTPKFVESVLGAIATSASKPGAPFISVTCNIANNAPISHISPKALAHKSPPAYCGDVLPQKHVDCWSLIMDDVPSRWLITSVESY